MCVCIFKIRENASRPLLMMLRVLSFYWCTRGIDFLNWESNLIMNHEKNDICFYYNESMLNDNMCPTISVVGVYVWFFRMIVTWLILPVVIRLSQRLSHASLSISNYTAKLRMAHYISYSLFDSTLLLG